MSRLLRVVYSLILVSAVSAAPVDFNRDIRPILSDHCYQCHGPDGNKRKAGLRLDKEEGSRLKLKSGMRAVVPGDLKASEMVYRIATDDVDERMPPSDFKKQLSKGQIELLQKWVKQGAKYQNHWSFEPLPKNVPVPSNKAKTSRNEIDDFIAKRLENTGLQSSGGVGRETWLRRVTFDLTGLPPTIDELDTFLSDSTPNAYEKIVDRLLDTDAYAERMTSEWLDVARYADTYGYQQDRTRYVWPWRDWVIKSFRKNLPYDQFVIWQLAGDLLPDATQDQMLATCFNRLHSQKVEGGSVPEEFRIEYVADRVHTFATAFLGLTFECTRCHDHKYDPLTQNDYYSISAFFNNIDEAGLYSWFTGSVPTPTLELGKLPSDGEIRSALEELVKISKSPEARAAFEKEKSNFHKSITKNFPAVSHFTFDELKGGKLANRSDPKKPASTSPNNKIIKGKIGQGLKLTGDDAVSLPKGMGDFNRHQPFSISLWINPSILLERAVILRRSQAWTDAASRGYELLLVHGNLSSALIHFWPGNAIRIRAPKPLPLNQWTHVVMAYDGSSQARGLNLFQNGKRVESVVVRDNLTREITGGGSPFLALGERMRDRGFKNGLVDELFLYDRVLTSSEIQELAQMNSKPDKIDFFQGFLETSYTPYKKQLAVLQKARKEFGDIRQRIPEIMVMREKSGKRQTHILERGLYSERRQVVTPNTPHALPGLPKGGPKNRLGLARWLTSDDHPLLARVTVNRYWQMIFGRGLVSTSEDFGNQGKPPTHPELLDWLARDFIRSGWDLRHLLEKMVLSATYWQKSGIAPRAREVDPENLLLSRGPAFRLPSEMIRDSALAVSSLLHQKIGGPGVKPYDLSLSFKPINPDKAPNVYRRSLYTFWKRTAPAPVMMTLDSTKRDVCMVRRERTDSAGQTLVLLNSPQFVEAARATAQNLIKKYGKESEDKLIANAFRLLTSRKPSRREMQIMTQLLAEQKLAFSDPLKAKEFLSTGEFRVKTADPTYMAAVTTLVSTLMNFDESISKR